jgi:hypothetical protein
VIFPFQVEGLDSQLHVTVLASPAGLADVPAFGVG